MVTSLGTKTLSSSQDLSTIVSEEYDDELEKKVQNLFELVVGAYPKHKQQIQNVIQNLSPEKKALQLKRLFQLAETGLTIKESIKVLSRINIKSDEEWAEFIKSFFSELVGILNTFEEELYHRDITQNERHIKLNKIVSLLKFLTTTENTWQNVVRDASDKADKISYLQDLAIEKMTKAVPKNISEYSAIKKQIKKIMDKCSTLSFSEYIFILRIIENILDRKNLTTVQKIYILNSMLPQKGSFRFLEISAEASFFSLKEETNFLKILDIFCGKFDEIEHTRIKS